MEDMQRPEGALLAKLRAAHHLSPSMRKAAGWAQMSDSRWRQIENGFVTTSRVTHPVEAPAGTLATMVRVLGGTSDELRAAGREDAAELLDNPPTQSEPLGPPPVTADQLRWIGDADLLREIERRFSERHTREEQGHAKSTAAISRAGGSPAPGAVEDLDRRRRKHPRHPAYGPDHFNDDEATPPSRGDQSEATPETDHDADGQADVHVKRAAQTRGRTPREFEAPDEGA